MWEELYIIHRAEKAPFVIDQNHEGHWLTWKTCLRQIAFGSPRFAHTLKLEKGDEIYQGEKAYVFCLEVTSGLRSRVIGETEILGQFKDLFLKAQFAVSPWGHTMRKLMQSILADVKTVRSQHLISLGSHSYGSFARRYLRDLRQVSFLGAGNLTQSMLPWLQKHAEEINVFCRDAKRYEKLAQEFSSVHFKNQTDTSAALRGGLIIAAPLSAQEIHAWIKSQGARFNVIMDLRDNSATDPVLVAETNSTVIKLNDFFSELQANQLGLEEKVKLAYSEVEKLAHLRVRNHVEIRPFGWEDLCG